MAISRCFVAAGILHIESSMEMLRCNPRRERSLVSKILTGVLPIALMCSSAMGDEVVQSNPTDVERARQIMRQYYTNEAESICSIDQSKLSEVFARSTEALKIGNSFSLALKSNDVVIAGEIHLYTDLEGRLELIRTFRKNEGSKACVAFEWPSRPGGLAEILRKLQMMAESDRKIGGEHLIRAENIERMIAYYKPMGRLATQLHMKAVTVDHRDRFEKDLSMDERNKAMSENISKLISNGTCKSVLMFVGKDHIATGPDSSVSLPQLIRAKSIRAVSVNIQMTHESSVPLDGRSWSGCTPPKIHEAVTIVNSVLPNDPKLFSETKDPTRWKDFDFTLLLP